MISNYQSSLSPRAACTGAESGRDPSGDGTWMGGFGAGGPLTEGAPSGPRAGGARVEGARS